MVYTYTPTYYSSLHDSITSICKNILPFSFKKRRGLPPSEQKLSKQQSDNLKWQQDSFHKILNLMGLHKEGILSESEVSVYRVHLLDTLIASPLDQEHPVILRDKLLFLQELFYAKCISEEEYHSSKRPLLQRLAVQGAEIDTRDVILSKTDENNNPKEEWSVIDLRDENCLINKDTTPNSKTKTKNAIKQIKGVASVLGLYKNTKSKDEILSSGSNQNELSSSKENPFWNCEKQSVLMLETLPSKTPIDEKKGSKKTLFHKEQRDDEAKSSAKKQWRFDGMKKWKKSNTDKEDETSPLPLSEIRSDNEAFSDPCRLVSIPIGEGPDTKQIKRKLHFDGSSSDFFIDKVLGDKIKSELSQIQSELRKKNSSVQFSDDQIEAISTKLPVDKSDLKKFFPKSWCDRYGDVVLDVVKKEFKDHVGDMEHLRNTTKERRKESMSRWTTFDNEENCHPNLFVSRDYSSQVKQQKVSTNDEDYDRAHCFETNPFLQEEHKMKVDEAAFYENQNPFWSPRFTD